MFHFDFLHYIESVNIQIVNQRSKQNISLSNTKIHGHMRRKLSSDSSTQSIWALCKVQGRLRTCSILFLGRIPSTQSNILFNENVFDVILPSQEKSFADFLIKRLFWETTQIDRSLLRRGSQWGFRCKNPLGKVSAGAKERDPLSGSRHFIAPALTTYSGLSPPKTSQSLCGGERIDRSTRHNRTHASPSLLAKKKSESAVFGLDSRIDMAV